MKSEMNEEKLQLRNTKDYKRLLQKIVCQQFTQPRRNDK